MEHNKEYEFEVDNSKESITEVFGVSNDWGQEVYDDIVTEVKKPSENGEGNISELFQKFAPRARTPQELMFIGYFINDIIGESKIYPPNLEDLIEDLENEMDEFNKNARK